MKKMITFFILFLPLKASSFNFLKLWESPFSFVFYSASDALYTGRGGLPGTQVFIREKAYFDISYTDWILDLNYVNFKTVKKIKNFGIELLVKYLDYGTFIGYDSLGQREQDFTSNSYAVYLKYAYLYNSYLSFGLELGFADQKIEKRKASSFFGGMGMIIKKDKYIAGIGVRNIGSSVKFYEESFSLPLCFYTFGSYDIKNLPLKFGGALSYYKHDFRLDIATLWKVTRMFDVFLSYQVGNDMGFISGLKFGFEVKYKGISLDYGISFLNDFGTTQSIGIVYRIN